MLHDNVIEFYEAGDALNVRWKATTKATYDRYEISIDSEIQFLGIGLGQLTKEQAENTLDFDTTGLSYYEESGELYLLPTDHEVFNELGISRFGDNRWNLAPAILARSALSCTLQCWVPESLPFVLKTRRN